MVMYVRGSDMCEPLRREALARYVYRFTRDHRPAWAGGEWKDGKPYPLQFDSDSDWLAHTFFPVTKSGRLANGPSECQSSPTWPDNPELRRIAQPTPTTGVHHMPSTTPNRTAEKARKVSPVTVHIFRAAGPGADWMHSTPRGFHVGPFDDANAARAHARTYYRGALMFSQSRPPGATPEPTQAPRIGDDVPKRAPSVTWGRDKVVEHEGRFFCTVGPQEGDEIAATVEGISAAECDERAHLVKAAPDLLAAAEFLLSLFGTPEMDDHFSDAEGMLTDAVWKARGTRDTPPSPELRVLKAAPAMLAALKVALPYLEHVAEEGAMLAEVRAAIAEAEGRG